MPPVFITLLVDILPPYVLKRRYISWPVDGMARFLDFSSGFLFHEVINVYIEEKDLWQVAYFTFLLGLLAFPLLASNFRALGECDSALQLLKRSFIASNKMGDPFTTSVKSGLHSLHWVEELWCYTPDLSTAGILEQISTNRTRRSRAVSHLFIVIQNFTQKKRWRMLEVVSWIKPFLPQNCHKRQKNSKHSQMLKKTNYFFYYRFFNHLKCLERYVKPHLSTKLSSARQALFYP